jgi:CRP-like cAMP-binding protein
MGLLWIGIPRTIQVGEKLFEEGAHDENFGCVLLTGQVDVTRNEELLEKLHAPELLGEILQFTNDRARTATVKAATPCSILAFDWCKFGSESVKFYDESEQALFKHLLTQCAWQRCAELFDEAARRAREMETKRA